MAYPTYISVHRGNLLHVQRILDAVAGIARREGADNVLYPPGATLPSVRLPWALLALAEAARVLGQIIEAGEARTPSDTKDEPGPDH